MRPLGYAVVEPIAQVVRVELPMDLLGKPRSFASLVELAELFVVRSKHEGTVGTDRQKLLVDPLWHPEPLVDSPLSHALEVVLVPQRHAGHPIGAP